MHRAISISFLTNTTGQIFLGTSVYVSTEICSTSKDGNVISQTCKSWPPSLRLAKSSALPINSGPMLHRQAKALEKDPTFRDFCT